MLSFKYNHALRDGIFVPIALPGRDMEQAAEDMRRQFDEIGQPQAPWNMLTCGRVADETDQKG